jgi:DMSO/TMAO reductase YedYZ molybdopterin-dependent catalytic subunit
MARRGLSRAITGLAAGALLTTPLLGVLAVAWVAGAPFLPYSVFEWLLRALPGSLVTVGLDLTLGALSGLGLDVADTAKTAEQVLAVITLFLAGVIVGLLFFVLVRGAGRRRVQVYGVAAGAALGAFSVATSLKRGVPEGLWGKSGFAALVVVLFLLWGWGLARLYLASVPRAQPLAAPPTPVGEAAAPAGDWAMSRRRFIIQVGGLVATIVVAGEAVAQVVGHQVTPPPAGPVGGPIAFPNSGSPVSPVPGTRAEYTPVADHYRVDIALTTPDITEADYRLVVDGLVATPLSLTLGQIRAGFDAVDQFATLSCISNQIGGPFIGTTLWTGVPLRDVLAKAGPAPQARFVRFKAPDGFDEEIGLDPVDGDPRIILCYGWDKQPLTRQHGFPLRVFIPDRYGMKQPKWITSITLTAESKPGYWVARNWDPVAEVKMTSVIDVVATKSLLTRDGRTFVPIGGIAYSGAKGISKVEVQIDEGPWQAAELRQPLSALTWVVWRYDWPFDPGTHTLTVRAFDSQGRPQETVQAPSTQGVAATGLFSEQRTIEPTP